MRYLATVLAGLLIAGAADAAPDPTVHYRLRPILTDGRMTAVEFEMRFHATGSQTEVDLPDNWARGKAYYTAFKDMEIIGATAVATPPDQPAHRLITATPGAEITVRYHVDANLKAGEEAPIATDMNYPLIGPNRFYILGESVWPTLAANDHPPAAFSADIPAGWAFASNLQDLASLSGTDADVVMSVMMGGTDVRIDTIQTPHTRLRIASAGRFNFTLADFSDRVQRLIATEQAFWGDGQPDFLVTLAPIAPEPGHMSNHGEGRSGGFAMITVPETPVETLSFSLAHEYFHSWNPGKLGGPDPDPEATGYWFSEGFTDYYGRKLALKAGVVSLAQFVADWNMSLDRYAGSKHKLASNKDLSEHAWTDNEWQKAPYDRGAILAVHLNAEWRTRGVTLDRFMHTLRDKVVADPKLAALPFRQRMAAVAASLGVPADDALTRFIDHGEAISLPEDAFGGCLRVVTENVADFDFGFHTQTMGGTRQITGVTTDGPAYAAGLRNGMSFVGFSAKDGLDSTSPLSITVRDSQGQTRTITYLPQGKTRYDRQKIVLPAGLTAEQAQACTAAITG
jgi:predicted metalloprotease with PDZ domain